MMDLDHFRAARVACPDLGAHFQDEAMRGHSGYLYANGTLYIENYKTGFYLLLYCQDWISQSLADLEEQLYDFALDEGFID